MDVRKKMNLESITLLVYTAINLKVLWPFISSNTLLLGATIPSNGNQNLLAIVLSLFLNAALVIFWLKKKRERDPQ